jgi:hypothetical protein
VSRFPVSPDITELLPRSILLKILPHFLVEITNRDLVWPA